MRLTSFGHCVQITFFPGIFPVNCYLVREEDGLTLVDAALPSSARSIQEAASSLGSPIRRIALTHAHADHIGALDRLHAALPEAEVLISERDSRLLRGDTELQEDEPRAKIRGGVKPTRTQPTRLLKGGDRIGSLEVVPSPGHTPGHVAFLDVRDGTLIAGDAFQTQAGLAVAGTVRPLFPFPAWGTWHRGTAVLSAKTLLALHPTRLAVGHGDVREEPQRAMQQAIEHAERGLKGGR